MPVGVRARFFDGLADPARLALLEALRDGEMTAGEAAVAASLSASNASKHLACLRDCGLVESRQEWRHVHYSLAAGVSELLDVHDRFIERRSQVAQTNCPDIRPPAMALPEGPPWYVIAWPDASLAVK